MDYFGLNKLLSLILCIFVGPILGVVQRFVDGKIVAGILRLVLGWNIIWVADFFGILFYGKILRLVDM